MNRAEMNLTQEVFQLVDRPVWIITAAAKNRRGGLLATWVSQASLDPHSPMLSIALARNHFTTELVAESKQFAAQLFGKSSISAAAKFALGSGRDRDKLADIPLANNSTGSPVLRDCIAWLDCRVIADRVVGDRHHFWGEVATAGRRGSEAPVTERILLRELETAELAMLREDRERDIEAQRRLWSEWLAENA